MDYFGLSQDFIEKSKHLDNLVALAKLFECTIQKIGCTYFVCASSVDPLNLPGHAVFLTNYPAEWPVYFSEKQYHKIDPIFTTAQSQITPFVWSDVAWRARLDFDQLNILNEASEIGLGEGYTVPIHTAEGYPASCSVVFDPGAVDPRALNSVHLMAYFLYESALKIMIANPAAVNEEPLTARQRQCLELVAQGKSDWAISRIIGVSESTVHYHIQKVLRRLKVSTRTQAIVQALFLGEIKFLDVKVGPSNVRGFVNLP